MTHDGLPVTSGIAPPPSAPLRLLRPAGAALLRRRFDVCVHGAEHVPADGPVLLAANHIGLFDGPLLTAVTPRPVHALVKREMFSGVGGTLFRALGQIPVDRAGVDPAAVKRAVRVLRDGGVVAVYPESTRGRGDVQHVRLGFAYLALVTGAPVVPVAHLGTRLDGGSVHAAPARGSRVDVVFGAPLRPTTTGTPWPRRSDEVARLAESLRAGLAEHVALAVSLTGRALPDVSPDILDDAAGRHGHEVGPQAREQFS